MFFLDTVDDFNHTSPGNFYPHQSCQRVYGQLSGCPVPSKLSPPKLTGSVLDPSCQVTTSCGGNEERRIHKLIFWSLLKMLANYFHSIIYHSFTKLRFFLIWRIFFLHFKKHMICCVIIFILLVCFSRGVQRSMHWKQGISVSRGHSISPPPGKPATSLFSNQPLFLVAEGWIPSPLRAFRRALIEKCPQFHVFFFFFEIEIIPPLDVCVILPQLRMFWILRMLRSAWWSPMKVATLWSPRGVWF